MREESSSDRSRRPSERSITTTGILIVLMIIALFSVLALSLVLNYVGLYSLLVRAGALFGFASMAIATSLASDLRFVFKNFGRPFMNIHHIFAILGIVLITVHPTVFAIEQMSIAVFAPRFDSWIVFWELAGRPALYVIYLGTVAALLRRKIKDYWKYLHVLNYLALFFGYIHGVLIGTDFANPIILAVFTGLIIITLLVPVYKYLIKTRK